MKSDLGEKKRNNDKNKQFQEKAKQVKTQPTPNYKKKNKM
jgi:hypothetical protein